MRTPQRLVVLLCLYIQLMSSFLLSGQEMTAADIMGKYGKAVVLIVGNRKGQEIGLGSGFIVKSDGVIITNYHVIEGSYPALVKLTNGDIYEDISVIDFNERQDIAVIKIKAFALPSVILGDSNTIRVGERIFIIGNPEGYENTISDGLLSQVRNSGEGYNLHQLSAPISHGSSGSPVFNQKGEVIGIATLTDKEGQNLNFSVPINYARGLINQSVKYSLKEFVHLPKESSLVNQRVEGNDVTKTWPDMNVEWSQLNLKLSTKWNENTLRYKIIINDTRNPIRIELYDLVFYDADSFKMLQTRIGAAEQLNGEKTVLGTATCSLSIYRQLARWNIVKSR